MTRVALIATAALAWTMPVFAAEGEEVIVALPANAASPSAPKAAETSCLPPSFSGMGSYNRSNLAAMIEDPEDLCTGRPLGLSEATEVLDRNEKAVRGGGGAAADGSGASAMGGPR